MKQAQVTIKQEALRLGFAFLALLIVGLMTNRASTDARVPMVITETIPAKSPKKIFVAPTQASPVATIGSRSVN